MKFYKKTIIHGEILTKEKIYFSKSFFTPMSEPRTPKKIKDRLEKYSKHHLEIDYHVFRGMKNYSSFCYTISVLQLFFHCIDFIDYISNETLTNHTEKTPQRNLRFVVLSEYKSS